MEKLCVILLIAEFKKNNEMHKKLTLESCPYKHSVWHSIKDLLAVVV